MNTNFFCPKCGQSLEAPSELEGRQISCPKCGQSVAIPDTARPVAPLPTMAVPPEFMAPVAPAPVTSGLAITSLVTGILGITVGCFCCLLPIAPIITGHMALSAIDRNPAGIQGRGMAMAGLVMGYVSLVISIIGIIVGMFMGAFSA